MKICTWILTEKAQLPFNWIQYIKLKKKKSTFYITFCCREIGLLLDWHFMKSENHQIIAVRNSLWRSQSPTCYSKLSQLPKQGCLVKVWASLGSLSPCLTSLTAENYFLTRDQNFPCCTVPLVPCPHQYASKKFGSTFSPATH